MDFPGSPVVKTPSSQHRGLRFDPWSRELRSHMLQLRSSAAKKKKKKTGEVNESFWLLSKNGGLVLVLRSKHPGC